MANRTTNRHKLSLSAAEEVRGLKGRESAAAVAAKYGVTRRWVWTLWRTAPGNKPQGDGHHNTTILPGYRVGDDGSVSRWLASQSRWRQLKVSRKGMVTVKLPDGRKTTLSVGRLVLMAFAPGTSSLGDRVIHFPDPDATNNRIGNLKWAPANAGRAGDPAMREYGKRSGAGERARILSDDEAARALDLLAQGAIAVEVAEVFDVERGVIDRLINGSYPHLPRPGPIGPTGNRRLRGDDHPMRKFAEEDA